MDSITHISNSINNLSKNCFIFSSYIEALSLLDNIPDHIQSKLNDEDFIHHIKVASDSIQFCSDYLDKHVNSSVKKILSKSSKNKSKEEPYADFIVDKPPVFKNETHHQLSFEDILKSHLEDGHPIKQVKHHDPHSVPDGTICPYCGADKSYIYDNNRRGQFLCKICDNTFTIRTSIADSIYPCCPHCDYKLSIDHDRSNYIVYVCPNKKCSYYLNNKKKVGTDEQASVTTSSGQLNLHYHYRDFKFSMDDLKKACEKAGTSKNLSKIHFSEKVLGLILTYYVNYGLSSRKTAAIMKDIHGIRISHQTVVNYANTVSALVKPLIDNYPYRLNSTLTGDETYIKVRGRNYYVFFFSDTASKIITYYQIYKHRDTRAACEAIYQSLRLYGDHIPEDLTIITDGNPIYNAAQLYFKLNGIDFTLHQVIGVKNKDDESKKYRAFKQIEERLNRTYKQNYYGSNGYDSIEGANTYMVLYVAFFNFLRRHSSLNNRPPVDDGLFEEDMLMPDKWLRLIELSYQYHQ